MKILYAIVSSLLISFVSGFFEDYPSEQPGCPYTPHAGTFFRVHEERKKTPEDNWVCNESYQNKLKICISMFKTITGRKLNSTYKVIKDKWSVKRECEEQQVTFLEPLRNDSELFDPTEITIGVWAFTCPITKMHLQFPAMQKFPPKEIIKDFYITKGKLDARPIVAVLQNSTYIDNICLRDIWIFDYKRIMTNYTS